MSEARERFEQELKRIQSELYAEMEGIKKHAEQELKLATGALAEKLTITYSIISVVVGCCCLCSLYAIDDLYTSVDGYDTQGDVSRGGKKGQDASGGCEN
jgi:hypothetical protein